MRPNRQYALCTLAHWAALLVLAATLACDSSKGPAGPGPQPCTYSLSENSQAFSSAAANGAVGVQTRAECEWVVQGAEGWVTLTSPAAGTGSGTVTYSVAANSADQARSMALTVAGLPFTVLQEGRAACTFAVVPLEAEFGDEGGTGRVTVTTTAGCGWAATSNEPWIVITRGARDEGSGVVDYRVAENNTTAARTGTLTVAGTRVTISQEGEPAPPADCAYTVSPTELSFHWHGSYGDGSDVKVTTASGCTWTASPGANWLVLVSGRSGSGSGTIRIDVDDHTGEQTRRAAVQVRWPAPTAGQNVWVNQEGCRYGLGATTATATAAGGPGEVFVLGDPVTLACPLGCPWSVHSEVPWIQITSGATGAGDNYVRYTVAANTTGAQRIGTLRIQGMTFTVTQAP